MVQVRSGFGFRCQALRHWPPAPCRWFNTQSTVPLMVNWSPAPTSAGKVVPEPKVTTGLPLVQSAPSPMPHLFSPPPGLPHQGGGVVFSLPWWPATSLSTLSSRPKGSAESEGSREGDQMALTFLWVIDPFYFYRKPALSSKKCKLFYSGRLDF